MVGSAAVSNVDRAGTPRRALRARAVAALVVLAIGSIGATRDTVPTVDLVPSDRASWRPRNLFAWLRPGHNYEPRSVLVETSPPGAMLDLFYVRSNFQKRYEQAEAPARVMLPPRVEAGLYLVPKVIE